MDNHATDHSQQDPNRVSPQQLQQQQQQQQQQEEDDAINQVIPPPQPQAPDAGYRASVVEGQAVNQHRREVIIMRQAAANANHNNQNNNQNNNNNDNDAGGGGGGGEGGGGSVLLMMDGVQEFEDELTTLQLHIENGEWHETLERIESHPEEILPVRQQGSGGGRRLSALHLACEGAECPLPVLLAMLQRQPRAAAMVDKDGNTPLHNACAGQYAYDPLVLCALLAAYPQAVLMKETVDQSTPLHLLLVLGGDVNLTCLTILLDVAYSPSLAIANNHDHNGLLCIEELQLGGNQPAAESLLLASRFPPLMVHLVRQMTSVLGGRFPQFLLPFLYLVPPRTLDLVTPQQQQTLLQQEQQPAPTTQTGKTTGLSNNNNNNNSATDQSQGGKTNGLPNNQTTLRRIPNAAAAAVPNQHHNDNSQERLLLLMTESKGQTPLHSACARSLDTSVIKVLTNQARYVRAHEAARMREHKDRFPLFYAACYGCPDEAIRHIFDLHPPAIHHVESYRILPVQVAYITPQYSNQDRQFQMQHGPRQDPTQTDTTPLFVLPSAVPMYKTMELLLRLTYHNSYKDPLPPPSVQGISFPNNNNKNKKRRNHAKWRVVHAAVAVPSPPSFVRSAIYLNPWQLSEHDEDGNIPLHIACRLDRREVGGIDPCQYWLRQGINQKRLFTRCLPEDRPNDNPIAILVHAYRKSAAYLDAAHCLPLHLAVLAGKGMVDGIQSLVKAAPLALATRDGQHHLYPFQLAAIGNVNTLDVVFELLIANPIMVQGGIGPTAATEPETNRPKTMSA